MEGAATPEMGVDKNKIEEKHKDSNKEKIKDITDSIIIIEIKCFPSDGKKRSCTT